MITFHSINEFSIQNEQLLTAWLDFVVDNEGRDIGELTFIFCDDRYLLDINIKYLKHNTLTDVITFDHTVGKMVSGDVYISIERVEENARELGIAFFDEIQRVMVHGVLHLCGYSDKNEDEIAIMRSKEDYYLSLRTFKN